MSLLEQVLNMLNPVGSAEASPLFPGNRDYPDYNVKAAQTALDNGVPLDEVWKKFKLYPWKDYAGKTTLLGEIPDTDARLRSNGDMHRFPGLVNTLLDHGSKQEIQPIRANRIDDTAGKILHHKQLFDNSPLLGYVPTQVSTTGHAGSMRGETTSLLSDNKDRYSNFALTLPFNDESLAESQAGPPYSGTYQHPSLVVATGKTNKQLLSTLLHELSHASAMTNGMNVNKPNMGQHDLDSYLNDPNEELARLAQLRLDYNKKQLNDESPATTTIKSRKLYKTPEKLRKLLGYQ